MVNRRYYRQQGERFDSEFDQNRDRQAQQFEREYRGDRYSQMGEQYGQGRDQQDYDDAAGGTYGGDYERSRNYRSDASQGFDRNRDTRQSSRSYLSQGYDSPGSRGGYENFTGNDFGGRDFSGGESYGYGDRSSPYSRYGAGNFGGRGGSGGGSASSRYGAENERGFFERAGDEVASWFGDEEAARRREADHSGYGPTNYTRSDDRILEDSCDRLTRDWAVDARQVQVTVQSGEVTLDGTVPSRQQKRRAEDCVDNVMGVKHVQNNLRVENKDSDKGEPIAFI